MELLETKEQFIELRAKGHSYDSIAKKLGKAKQTLIDWGKELQDEVANLRALELDSLYEKYYLYKEARLKAYGELLNKIRAELVKRDLSDIATDKLLDLYLKYESQVREEIVEPIFKSQEEVEDERTDRKLLEDLTRLQVKPSRRLKAV